MWCVPDEEGWGLKLMIFDLSSSSSSSSSSFFFSSCSSFSSPTYSYSSSPYFSWALLRTRAKAIRHSPNRNPPLPPPSPPQQTKQSQLPPPHPHCPPPRPQLPPKIYYIHYHGFKKEIKRIWNDRRTLFQLWPSSPTAFTSPALNLTPITPNDSMVSLTSVTSVTWGGLIGWGRYPTPSVAPICQHTNKRVQSNSLIRYQRWWIQKCIHISDAVFICWFCVGVCVSFVDGRAVACYPASLLPPPWHAITQATHTHT